jgi:lysophospholipase L1-like esterase
MKLLKLHFLLCCLVLAVTSLNAAETSDYVIVLSKDASPVEKLASKELTLVLEESIDKKFTVVSPAESAKEKGRVIVGRNELSSLKLGIKNIEALQDQQSWVKSDGRDLYLIGGGKSGTLYAVYDFLENQLGCRWYTAFGDIKIPKHPELTFKDLNYKTRPAFAVRSISSYFYNMVPESRYFLARNRMNEGLRSKDFLPAHKVTRISPGSHTFFHYLPPFEKSPWAWQKKLYQPKRNNWFKSNPEYFSMKTDGTRSGHLQVCFSSKGLRKELTTEIFENIKFAGGKGAIELSPEDVPGNLCNCPECLKLVEKYKTIAGPMFDFVLEICPKIKKEYPEVQIWTLAYRKKQTEVPPAVESLPDNFYVRFAAIDDDFSRALSDPENADTFKNLKKWLQITPNIIVRGYVNPYCRPSPPYGNVEMLVDDIRTSAKVGAMGFTPEHTARNTWIGANFTTLQSWLILRLSFDPTQDLKLLIKEFTDYYYGPAAGLVRQYMQELEDQRRKSKLRMKWNPTITVYPWLTPANIIKWEKLFDQMEDLCVKGSKELYHVKILRMTLDMSALNIWHQLLKEYPVFSPDSSHLEKRIRNTFEEALTKVGPVNKVVYRKTLNQVLDPIAMLARKIPAELPEQFSKLPANDVRRTFPVKKYVKDEDAAMGIAIVAKYDKLPFDIGLYDTYAAKWGYSKPFKGENIETGKYKFYKVGRSRISPECVVWLTKKWLITIPLGQFFIMGDPNKEWDIYLSLKFSGPAFDKNSTAKENTISYDQTVLVAVKDSNAPKNNITNGVNRFTVPTARTSSWIQTFYGQLEKDGRDCSKDDVIMLGDSITAGWYQHWVKGNGTKVLAKLKKDTKYGIYPCSVSGDETQNVLYILSRSDSFFKNAAPKVITLMIGVNNITRNKSPEAIPLIAEGTKKILAVIREKYPQTKVLLFAVLPHFSQKHTSRSDAFNKIIVNYADWKNVFYVDMGHKFNNGKGGMIKELTTDGIHLNEKGYQVWADFMKPYLVDLIENNGKGEVWKTGK